MARGQGERGDGRGERRERAATPEDKRAAVGDILRRAYDETLAEAVPDVFADLLRQLD